jgi:hypothetical protein
VYHEADQSNQVMIAWGMNDDFEDLVDDDRQRQVREESRGTTGDGEKVGQNHILELDFRIS